MALGLVLFRRSPEVSPADTVFSDDEAIHDDSHRWERGPESRGAADFYSGEVAREIAAVEKLDEASAIAKIDEVLAKAARHARVAAEAEARNKAA